MALANILAPRQQVLTAAGSVLAGGKVFLFEPGTTTFVTSFRDSGLVTPHTNPVRLSGSGRANIWITRDVDMFIVPRTNVSDLIPSNPVVSELSANPDSLGASESGGLVTNGSFEIDTDSNLVPDGYTLASEAGSTNVLDASQSTDGSQSFRFTSSGVGGGSLVTNDFFPVNAVDPLRVNIDLRSTIAGVRNIVRVEWYDVSQVSISNSDPYDSTANPAVFTTQNLVVAPPALARFAKIRLIGIDPSVALAGSTYFDRLSVFYPAVVSGVFDNITIQNNEIITTNLNGDLNLRPNGTGSTVIDFNGNPVARVSANSLRVHANTVTATPPTTEAVSGDLSIYDADNTDLLAQVAFSGSNQLNVSNLMRGGAVQIRGVDAAGVTRPIMVADPDIETVLYAAGQVGLIVAANNIVRMRADIETATPPTTEAVSARFEFHDLSGTDQLGIFGYFGTHQMRLRNTMHGGGIRLTGEDNAGAERTLLDADPDGELQMYFNGGIAARTHADGINVQDSSASSPFIGFLDSTSTRLAFMQALSTSLTIRSENNGVPVQIQGHDAGGTNRNIIVGDADGAITFYHGGIQVIASTASGAAVRDTVAANPVFQLSDNAGVELARLSHTAGVLRLKGNVNGATVQISADDAGGVERSIILGDPDGGMTGYFAGAAAYDTIDPASGGLRANNTLTGSGAERVLTTSDLIAAPMRGILDANLIITNSVVLNNVNNMTFSLAAATRYKVRFVGFVESGAPGASPGARFRLDYANGGTLTTATAIGRITGHRAGTLTNSIRAAPDLTSAGVDCGSLGDENMIVWEAFFETILAGDLTMQFTQAVANVAASVLLEGAYMEVIEA